MSKEIFQYKEVRDKILSGLDKLSNPVIQTLTPQGKNVIVQDDRGITFLTRDGYTIAKHIDLEDPIENSIVDIVKQSAFQTNEIAGDGTSTSILLSQTLIKGGFREIDSGLNPTELTYKLNKLSELIIKELDKCVQKIENKEQLSFIANVSSGNDKEISENIVKAVISSGEDGLVFIETNPNFQETEVVEEMGYLMDSGMFSHLLTNTRGRFIASYEKPLVFITDKRMYYEEECLEILNKVASMGRNKLVIIAKDFIGQAQNILIANHLNQKVNMSILLIKEEKNILEDIADYLGGQVFTEKRGSITKNLKNEDFIEAEKVFSDQQRSVVVSSKKKNPIVELRIKALKEELKKDLSKDEKESFKRRIACLTNGIITIKVGSTTPSQTREKIYRYEDALNAERGGQKFGYVVGGGLTLLKIYEAIEKKLNIELKQIVKNFCLAPIKQIAINWGKTKVFNYL